MQKQNIVQINFDSNTKKHREECLNNYLENSVVDSITSFSGTTGYGIIATVSEWDEEAAKQTFVTVNFDGNSLKDKQLEPIRDMMNKGWNVKCMTGFSSFDGEQFGVAAVLEQCECDEEG